jgi:competence protein ComFC
MTVRNSSARFSRLWRSLTSLLLPAQCVGCGVRLAPEERFVCAACRSTFEPVPQPSCDLCGGPLTERGCPDCLGSDFSFHQARAIWVYDGPVRAAIHALKYNGFTRIAEELLDEGEPLWRGLAMFQRVDGLVPVPLHPVRRRQRGFNQAERIAAAISYRTGLPVLEKLVIRIRPTRSQTRLPQEQRRVNLAEAFGAPDPSLVRGKSLLIVDDVFTTGATVDSLSKALTSNGAREVLVFTLARAGLHKI